MDAIAPDSVFVPVDGLELTEVPDGRVIYQASRERVHYLNPTAVIVFELCGLGQSAAQIGKFLEDAYSLPEPPMETVGECIRSLVDEELLRPSPR